MAGLYLDAPDNRMPWDIDGSTAFFIDGVGTVNPLSGANAIILNNENADNYQQPSDGWIGVLFPENRNITGVYVSAGDSAETWGSLSASANTTNGFDGTWVNQAIAKETSSTLDRMRQNIIATPTFTNARAVRLYRNNLSSFSSRKAFRTFHVYGDFVAAYDGLQFWDPALDQRVGPAHFDFAELERTATATKTFRVKNLSAQNAQGVSVSFSVLSDPTPSLLTQFELSTDDITYSSTINIGDINAGATTGVLYIRATLAANSALSLQWLRLKTTVTTWV